MMCDSVNDCGDASDEYDSVCRKQITLSELQLFCIFPFKYNYCTVLACFAFCFIFYIRVGLIIYAVTNQRLTWLKTRV